MTGTTPGATRFGAFLGILLLATLAAEGALSLLAGRSLAELVRGPPAQIVAVDDGRPSEDDLNRAAAGNVGPYKGHVDPLVGIVTRADDTFELAGGTVTTDRLGMRVRPAGPVPEEALHVVVLGDSVAFGWGVDDDQTLAAQLERVLADVRPADARPVACSTVAVPGWNHRNAVHFLLDHWDLIQPDVVLYMPIGNDLTNSYGVRETGHRRDRPDIATPDPWLDVSIDRSQAFVLDVARRLVERGETLEAEALGPPCLNADVSAESARRYDANAASIEQLADFLAARGVPLLLLQYTEEDYLWHLWARLAARGAELPVLPLLEGTPREFTLADDPHPNPETQRVLALWTAAELLRRGWVDGARPADLPPAPEAYAARRAPRREPAEWARRAARHRQRAVDDLRPRIHVPTGRGVFQIYGGVNPDGSARRHVLAVLPDAGPELRVDLAPLPERPDAYPLVVDVDVDGALVGRVTVPADAPVEAVFELPERGGGPLEVRLRAARAVTTFYRGRPQMSAYRLRALEVGDF